MEKEQQKLPPGYYECIHCHVIGHIENMEPCRERTGMHPQCSRGHKFLHSHRCVNEHLGLPEKKSPIKVGTRDTTYLECKYCGQVTSIVNLELCPYSSDNDAKCLGNYYHMKCLNKHVLKKHPIL